MNTCLLCDPAAADREFSRVRVWEDELWRLSVVLRGPVPGFAHLEPKRHIPYVTDLTSTSRRTGPGTPSSAAPGCCVPTPPTPTRPRTAAWRTR